MPLKDGQTTIAVTPKIKATLEAKKHLYRKKNISDTIEEIIKRSEKHNKEAV